MEQKRRGKLRIAAMIIGRFFFVLLALLTLTVYGLYSLCQVIFNGPSPTARDKLVISALETSAMKFVPELFLPAVEVALIVDENRVVANDEITDPNLITFEPPTVADDHEPGAAEPEDEWADYPDGIRIETIRGDTYRGYVMLVRDPSRVFVGTSSDFVDAKTGMTILQALEKEEAIGGINGGGFPDDGGVMPGNVPIGFTMSRGKVLWGSQSTYYTGVIGMDENNVLIVGNMTGKQAIERGMRDCVCFGPVLVVNGEAATVTGVSSGVNPRTAIGQRADGTMLLVCVDGRMVNSLGATYADLIDIFITYGAVNAANLDGGTSTAMAYNNELVSVPSSLSGPRRMPTFFLVQ